MNLKQKDLVPYIGNKSKVSEVLNRKVGLSLSMIYNLAKGLHLPLEVLVQPSDKKRLAWPYFYRDDTNERECIFCYLFIHFLVSVYSAPDPI